MTDHTPKPWQRRGKSYRIQIDDKFYLVPKWEGTAGTQRDRERLNEIVERVLACVNACAGIPTEQLGDVKALIEAAIIQERDHGACTPLHYALAPFQRTEL